MYSRFAAEVMRVCRQWYPEAAPEEGDDADNSGDAEDGEGDMQEE